MPRRVPRPLPGPRSECQSRFDAMVWFWAGVQRLSFAGTTLTRRRKGVNALWRATLTFNGSHSGCYGRAMARKASADQAPNKGFNDIVGFVLTGLGLLLLLMLLSYHPHDTGDVVNPPNRPVQNWIGPFGAIMARGWIVAGGMAAYLLPFVLVFLGLGCFFEALGYVRRRWLWTIVLFCCCAGLLDLYAPYLAGIHRRLNTTAGGIIGMGLNHYGFNYFGTAGATIIYLTMYFISLLFLTNFRLTDWARSLLAKPEPAATGSGDSAAASAEERALETRARTGEAGAQVAGTGGQSHRRVGRRHEACAGANGPRPQRAAKHKTSPWQKAVGVAQATRSRGGGDRYSRPRSGVRDHRGHPEKKKRTR